MAEKIMHSTGLWSIREGNKLSYGRGKQAKSVVLSATDKITLSLLDVYRKQILKMGKNPDDFCHAGYEIIPRILINEAEQCILHDKNRILEDKAKAKAYFEAAQSSGEAYRTAEIPAQHDAELSWARRFTAEEKLNYAEWYRDRGLGGFSASPRRKVAKSAVEAVVGNRASDGSFLGCENQAWIISEAEWDEIIRVSDEIDKQQAIARQQYEQAAAKDIADKIASGYCFSCQTWCHGDCGNYSNNPNTHSLRALHNGIKEQNYGIGD